MTVSLPYKIQLRDVSNYKNFPVVFVEYIEDSEWRYSIRNEVRLVLHDGQPYRPKKIDSARVGSAHLKGNNAYCKITGAIQ